MYYKSRSYRLFNYLNIFFIAILAFLCVAPLLHILAMSFSSRDAALANAVGLWPVGFTLEPYITTLKDGRILTSLWNSVERLILFVSFDMFITILVAYYRRWIKYLRAGHFLYGFLSLRCYFMGD